MGEDYRFIGKAAPRMDAREIVTGSADFLGDTKMLNLLHAKVLRSPSSARDHQEGRQDQSPGITGSEGGPDV